MLEPQRLQAVGAMSGTSLDGVDVAAIETDGENVYGFGARHYRPYAPEEQATLKAALGRWPGEDLGAALAIVQQAHVEALFDMGGGVIGFHGQTLAHEPKGMGQGRGTHQLGDGQALADALERPVVWDFRTEDVERGGQGAPLAPFYHFACARHIGATAPLAILNLGGVGNITWIDPRKSAPEATGALLAFDTGPANAPLNDLMVERCGLSHDENGKLARGGRVDQAVLEAFLAEPFFTKIPPKSLDRNDFAIIRDLVRDMSDADAAATICAMVAGAVVRGMEHLPERPELVLVTGGGRHNPIMMDTLAADLGCPVAPVEAVGLDGDMLEAQAFAFLAVRVMRGLPTSCPGTTGVRGLVGGGIVSHPGQ